MFGISGQEFIVLLVLAAVVLGPERLPQYTAQLAQLVRGLRRSALGATEQMRAELGPEFDEIDWRKLDPRQYDPRRIVREALAETFDPDDPLGLKSVQQDMRESTDDVRRAMTDTIGGAQEAVRKPRRQMADATPAAGAASAPAPEIGAAPRNGGDPARAAGATEDEQPAPTGPAAPSWDPDTI